MCAKLQQIILQTSEFVTFFIDFDIFY